MPQVNLCYVKNLISDKGRITLDNHLEVILSQNNRFKNTHSGERCFILGNGPSLKNVDLSLLADEFVFTVNNFAFVDGFEKVKTNVHLWMDMAYFNARNDVKLEKEKLMLSYTKIATQNPICFVDIAGLPFIKQNKLDEILQFNYLYQGISHIASNNPLYIDISKPITGFHNVVHYAIVIAIFMGFKKIYLLGCDATGILETVRFILNLPSLDDHAYSDPEEVSKRNQQAVDNIGITTLFFGHYCIFLGYDKLYYICKNLLNVDLINCSSQTLITSIPRKNLSDVLGRNAIIPQRVEQKLIGSPLSIADYLPIDRQFEQRGTNFLTMGAGSYIGGIKLEFVSENAHLLIGRYSSLASRLYFSIGENHNYRNVTTYPFRQRNIKTKIALHPNWTNKDFYTEANHYQIIIGNDVWIGSDVKILGGVKIGSGAVIGANSVVAKDIPPYAVAVGNPARVIKYRFDEETIKKFMQIQWWNWSTEKIWANAELLENPKQFIDKFYSPELDNFGNTVNENILRKIEKAHQDGGSVYTFIADFQAKKPLWPKIIKEFLSAFEKDDAALLILWTGEGYTQENHNYLKKFISSIGKESFSEVLVFLSTPKEIFSPYVLRKSDYFITTRDIICLQCIDYLYGTATKVISALDDEIFAKTKLIKTNGGGQVSRIIISSSVDDAAVLSYRKAA